MPSTHPPRCGVDAAGRFAHYQHSTPLPPQHLYETFLHPSRVHPSKLKAKINGHKATIAEDYQDLKEIVMDKRREEMLQKWILNKQKHTYVRIDPNWQKCDFKYPGWVRND